MEFEKVVPTRASSNFYDDLLKIVDISLSSVSPEYNLC